ncbi:MAG TPA: tetratricopeptide repeat protein [Bacteroidota bacterium]|nr:tetratricopeptide repeat protein [Bacteroidota bacterium]
MTQIAVAQETPADLMNRAYQIQSSNPDEAARLLKQAIEKDPSSIAARRQLGYLYLNRSDYDGALEQFQASEKIHSSDTIKLQIAYILGSLHRRDDEKQVLTELSQSSNPGIQQKASEELASLSTGPAASRRYLRFYADPYYDTRWDDFFLHFNFQSGYHLTEDQKVTLYGVLALSADTRSSSGTVPQIISDNTLLLGGGILIRPFYGFQAFIQDGVAFDLVRHGADGDPRNDFRAVAIYGNGIYAPFNVHPEFKSPMYPFADMYSSFGYYSRYKNGIGYLQGRAGLRAVEVSRTALDVYLRGDYVFDTEKEYYNNLVEGGAGINLTPDMDWGLNFIAEYHRGMYLNVSPTAEALRSASYEQWYNSFRFYLIFEKTF